MEKEGFGEEFSICPSFCFGEIRGGQKTEKRIRYCASTILLFLIVRDYGVHPRHSPRTFPLGLLAPRCLGFLLILAIPALRSGGEGRRLFGGRKESFPQLRSPPRRCDVEYSVLPFVLWSFRVFWLRLACLRSPPSHNPLPRFHIGYIWCHFRYWISYCKITAALIL